MENSIKNIRTFNKGKFKDSLLDIWGGIKTIGILLLIAPFIILAGLIYGEKCDDIYE